jgi:hypothetical protein
MVLVDMGVSRGKSWETRKNFGPTEMVETLMPNHLIGTLSHVLLGGKVTFITRFADLLHLLELYARRMNGGFDGPDTFLSLLSLGANASFCFLDLNGFWIWIVQCLSRTNLRLLLAIFTLYSQSLRQKRRF